MNLHIRRAVPLSLVFIMICVVLGLHWEVNILLAKEGTSEPQVAPLPGGSAYVMYSIKKGQYHIVSWLMDHGAKIDYHNFHGQTALDFAKGRGQTDLVKYLLSHNAVE